MKMLGRQAGAWAVVLGFALVLGSGCESVGLRSMRIYIQQRNWAKALAQGRIAVAESPNDAEAWFAIAQVAAQVDSFDLMLRAMDRTAALTKKHNSDIGDIRLAKYNGVFNQAVEMYNAGDLPGATERLNLAIRIDSTRGNAYKVMGMVHQRGQDIPGAIAAYRRAYVADSTDIDSGRQWAILLGRTGDTDGALKVIERLYAANPGHKQVAFTAIQLLSQAGRYDRALSIAQSGLAQNPDDAEFNARAGVIWMEKAQATQDSLASRADLEAALPYFQHALAADSANTDVAFNVATCYRQLGRLDDAIRPLQRVLQARPDDNQSRVQLAIVLLQEERPDEAEPHLLEVVQRIGEPTNAQDRELLARSYRYLSIIYTVRGNELGTRGRALQEEADAIGGRARQAEKAAKLREANRLMDESKALFDKGHEMDRQSHLYSD